MDLLPRGRGSEIILSIQQSNVVRTRNDIVSDIEKTANMLLKRSYKVRSRSTSLSEICGVLWLAESDKQSATPSSYKRRKTSFESFRSPRVVAFRRLRLALPLDFFAEMIHIFSQIKVRLCLTCCWELRLIFEFEFRISNCSSRTSVSCGVRVRV